MYAVNEVFLYYPCLCRHLTRISCSWRFISASSVRLLNYYNVLGVPKDATRADIKDAYFRKSKLLHPDAKPNDPAQHQKFVELNNAYAVLSKTLSRRDYDLELQGIKVSPYRGVHVYRSSTSYPFGSANERVHHDFYGFKYRKPNAPYYGIKGVKKMKNTTVLIGCILLLIASTVLHFVLLHYGGRFTTKQLDARDQRIGAIYSKVKQRARENGIKKQAELLTQHYEEFHRKNSKKVGKKSSGS